MMESVCPADYDWKNTTSLGLRLVRSLTKQLNGTVVMTQNGGTVFTIMVKPQSHSGEMRLMPEQLSLLNNP